MRILSTFDRVVTEVLADKVRARLTFKVNHPLWWDIGFEIYFEMSSGLHRVWFHG